MSEATLAKGVYLLVKESTAMDLETPDELKSALQLAGYNPSDSFMTRYWEGGKSVTFEQFNYILQTEPLPRNLDLVSYFKALDPDNKGWISHADFLSAMTARGQKLDEEFVKKTLNDPQFNVKNEEKFDYATFCRKLLSTSNELAQLAIERAKKMEEKLTLNSKTYTKRSSPKKSVISKMKGAFYFEGETIISHQYIFKPKKPGLYDVSIQSPVDCHVFLFRILNDEANSPDRKLRFVSRFSSAQVRLESGSYLAIPFTAGCRLKKRAKNQRRDEEKAKLVDEKSRLTDEFKNALIEIFTQVDLDGNGTLSRTEFNLFNWRTSGEEVQDEEWNVVLENFPMINGELTLDGFLQLHQMEAEDNSGELGITLNAMGFDASELLQDEAAVFTLRIQFEERVEMNVSGLRSGGSALDKAMIKCVMDGGGKVEVDDHVTLFRDDDRSRSSSFVVQNRSAKSIAVNFDFNGSENVLINHPHLNFTVRLSAKSTIFAAQIVPKDITRPFHVKFNASLSQ